MKLRTCTILSFCFVFLLACNTYSDLPSPKSNNDWKVKRLPSSPQKTGGDAAAGFQYLTTGDYIGSGIPYAFIEKKLGDYKDTLFYRSDENSRLPFYHNAFDALNGAKVMSGNCFTCHATTLNGQFMPGLGNSLADFRENNTNQMRLIRFLVNRKFKKKSPERADFETYGKINTKALPYIVTPNPGVNPAFRLEEAYGNFRNPSDLTFTAKAQTELIKYTLASDTPPWWNMKKKNALYYNGMGRGDFRKLLMQASLQGIKDSLQARQILGHFEDVLAYLENVEAPTYPEAIEEELAMRGRILFEEHCEKCHGSYGENETYPNKLVALEVVKTDPYYARYFSTQKGLKDWYNQSWYATSEPTSHLEPLDAYVAPPLDGIWASAPYLHNASVPTLDDLLNSAQRPAYWERSLENDDYDFKKVGWRYMARAEAEGKYTYDTTLPGYSNRGHYFGDVLTTSERKAVIEYLKTL